MKNIIMKKKKERKNLLIKPTLVELSFGESPSFTLADRFGVVMDVWMVGLDSVMGRGTLEKRGISTAWTIGKALLDVVVELPTDGALPVTTWRSRDSMAPRTTLWSKNRH